LKKRARFSATGRKKRLENEAFLLFQMIFEPLHLS
jgi:hypothetical protein